MPPNPETLAPDRPPAAPIGGRAIGSGRSITPRRGLPSSRAVVGGLLVALAALGTWAAASGTGQGDPTRYAVATKAIGPGQRIEPGDVGWAEVDLPAAQRGQAFTDGRQVIGAVALGPLAPGDLLQAGALAPAAGRPEEREVSFAVDADWAVAGRLRSGDRIDVFATAEDGADGASSTLVLGSATIRRIDTSDGDGFAASNRQIITVGIDSGADAEALITAARGGDLTVLRVTGTTGSGASTDADDQPDPKTDGGSDAGGAASKGQAGSGSASGIGSTGGGR